MCFNETQQLQLPSEVEDNLLHRYYKVGGALPPLHPSYVERSADLLLYERLSQGLASYVLGPRQSGKSSLRVRAAYRLAQAGHRCVTLHANQISDLAAGTRGWYRGLMLAIGRALNFSNLPALCEWLNAASTESLQRQLDIFAREFLAAYLQASGASSVVVFIDEIDYLIGAKLSIHPLLDWLCRRRDWNSAFADRFNVVMLGTTTIQDLVAGRSQASEVLLPEAGAITLDNFQLSETVALAAGLSTNLATALLAMERVLFWTAGQPFLTQKLCQLLIVTFDALSARNPLSQPLLAIDFSKLKQQIDDLVRSAVIDNWQVQDQPAHLRPIGDRLLRSPRRAALLQLYAQILSGETVPVIRDQPVQAELRLSGLVSSKNNQLQVTAPIYRQVFNAEWLCANG